MLNRFPASNALCMRNYKFKFNCIAFRFNLCNKCICAIMEWHAYIFWVSALSIITAVWHSHTGPSLCRTNWKLHQRSQWSAPNIQIIEWFIGWTLWIQSHTQHTHIEHCERFNTLLLAYVWWRFASKMHELCIQRRTMVCQCIAYRELAQCYRAVFNNTRAEWNKSCCTSQSDKINKMTSACVAVSFCGGCFVCARVFLAEFGEDLNSATHRFDPTAVRIKIFEESSAHCAP